MVNTVNLLLRSTSNIFKQNVPRIMVPVISM
jgi:hypothetical protein